MSEHQSPDWLPTLNEFLARPVVRKGLSPLKDSIEIGVTLSSGESVTITKEKGQPTLINRPAEKPDMGFSIPPGALAAIKEFETEDLGQMAIFLFGLLTDADPNRKMVPKLNIGVIGLVTKGYLATIPLGGATLMKYLATKGFGSLGAIKNAISRLREGSK
ncbi:MAG: hypothetical protein H6617_04420 [Bdellovibrionaceae bacterium]|nr:hypothetical protein [Bdellovibrionales bacterium]MCB9253905.1 hypothetical protein [Pseudobdellovibrionaceae bacterium]